MAKCTYQRLSRCRLALRTDSQAVRRGVRTIVGHGGNATMQRPAPRVRHIRRQTVSATGACGDVPATDYGTIHHRLMRRAPRLSVELQACRREMGRWQTWWRGRWRSISALASRAKSMPDAAAAAQWLRVAKVNRNYNNLRLTDLSWSKFWPQGKNTTESLFEVYLWIWIVINVEMLSSLHNYVWFEWIVRRK